MILKKNYIIIIIEIVMKVNEILKKNVHYFNIHMLNLILRYFYNKILRRNCLLLNFHSVSINVVDFDENYLYQILIY